jgi:16S rRNA (adenine1518-N6/adenine1519-N6)-dimethyltransferase
MEHRPRKRFGQNFLHDTHIIHKIVQAIHPQAGEQVVEIGPGLGALTQALLTSAAKLDVIEIDRDLVAGLQTLAHSYPQLNVHHADALQFNFQDLATSEDQLRVVGNLPYNISTPLLFHLLSQIQLIKDMHFMLQKEVVERMAASPGSQAYGRLSVMVQYYCQVHYLFTVKPGAFYPAPKVDSAIVRLIPYHKLPHVAQDYAYFSDLVLHAFNQRRKTLHNSLKKLVCVQQIKLSGIDPDSRPERLSVADFVNLSNSGRA